MRARRGALVMMAAALTVAGVAPAAGGAPPEHAAVDLPPPPFRLTETARTDATDLPTPRNKQRQRAGGHVPAAGTISDYVDTCGDSSDPYDIRRAYVSIAQDAEARFSVSFCDGRDPENYTGKLTWDISAAGGDRWLTVEKTGGTWKVTFSEGGTHAAWVAAPGEPGRPVKELHAEVPATQLGLAGDCETSTDGCLTFTVKSLVGGSTDVMPNAGTVKSRAPWPSPCTSAATVATHRATLAVEAGRSDDVAASITAAGYPAVAYEALGLVEVTQGVSEEVLAALRDVDGVRSAARPKLRHRAELIPDDERYDEQWYLDRLGMPDGWERSTGSPTVRIGILDDGVDGTRQEFVGRVAAGFDAVNGVAIPAAANSDLGAHGTAVAGFAAATGNDGKGIAGVDWRAQIVPIRVMDHEQCITDASYMNGLEWAARHGNLDVLNVSLGGAEILADGNGRSERDVVRQLTAQQTVIVAATGNQGDRGFAPSFPAAIAEVIAVGATGPDDTATSYSNRGAHVDVVAPGGADQGSPGTDLVGLSDRTLNGDVYFPLAGTSFSTPLVTGLAALYRARHPDTTVADVTRALLGSTRDLGDELAGFDRAHGFGMPVADRMLTADPGRLTHRLAGADRFATAVEATRRAFPDGELVSTVLLATGVDFPDALAGSPLAARLHAPLLLATPTSVPKVTMTELERLSPDRVILLGGTAALGASVEAQLAGAGFSVQRIAGVDRYDTAARIATGNPDGTPSSWTPWPGSDLVYVATGAAFPDALAGGAVAAAFDAPLLLTPKTGLAGSTLTALRDRLMPSVVVLLGGDAAVSAQVEQQIRELPSTRLVIRASGPDRFATAARAQCPHEVVCIPDTRFSLVATGVQFADALSGGAAAAALRAPLLLVPPSGKVPPAVLDELAAVAPEQALILGGHAAVDHDVEIAVASRVTR